MNRENDEHGIAAALHEHARIAEPDWDAMERRLVAALERQQPPRRASDASRRAPHVRRWLGAAAGVLLAAALTFYQSYQPLTRRGAAPKPPEPPPQASSPAEAAPAPRAAPPAATPAAPAPRARTGDRTPRLARPVPASTSASAAAPAAAPPPAPAAGALEFLALPGASALPDLESGRVVRVAMPLTMLPAYGIDLVPDAAPAAVAADLLIGQDGVPRAIRLAPSTQESGGAAREQRR